MTPAESTRALLTLGPMPPARATGARATPAPPTPGPATPARWTSTGEYTAPDACAFDGWCWVYPAPFGAPLNDVWGAAPNDVWAVGPRGLVAHFDGASWSVFESPATDFDLRAVHGTAADEVFAVGDGGVILRWDGAAWTLGELPDEPRPPRRLRRRCGRRLGGGLRIASASVGTAVRGPCTTFTRPGARGPRSPARPRTTSGSGPGPVASITGTARPGHTPTRG